MRIGFLTDANKYLQKKMKVSEFLSGNFNINMFHGLD